MTCPKCKRDILTEASFGTKRNGRRQPYCKDCQRRYAKEHYQRNKQKYLNKARIRNVLIRERNNEVVDRLKNRPCSDCGVQYPPWVMDFDHSPGETKLECISHMKYFAIRNILNEIKKCDVVCSNCHRQRTHLRRLRSVSAQ